MFEFLQTQTNTENPTEITILITVLASFFLSSLIVLTYELTTKEVHRPVHFLQGMALIAIVSATIMQAIGDSLARGLGMLGALAIIRFRTKLDDPRNITFMFASIAAGIACGVFGFTTAFIGTFGFCLAAIILRFSPLSNQAQLIGNLRIKIPRIGNQENEINQILKKFCQYYELQEVRFMERKIVNDQATPIVVVNDSTEDKDKVKIPVAREPVKELNYVLRISRKKNLGELTEQMEQIAGLSNFRIRFSKQNFRL